VRQGDSNSPTLFTLFINGLEEEIKQLNRGIDINGRNISIILFADDIVLISENEENLQHMLAYMHYWCYKWKLKLNVDKSNIVHFRPKRHNQTEFILNHAVFESINLCNVENAHKQLVYENNRQWNEIVHSKPKLRTYI